MALKQTYEEVIPSLHHSSLHHHCTITAPSPSPLPHALPAPSQHHHRTITAPSPCRKRGRRMSCFRICLQDKAKIGLARRDIWLVKQEPDAGTHIINNACSSMQLTGLGYTAFFLRRLRGRQTRPWPFPAGTKCLEKDANKGYFL